VENIRKDNAGKILFDDDSPIFLIKLKNDNKVRIRFNTKTTLTFFGSFILLIYEKKLKKAFKNYKSKT
jgi:hypothetical protein